MKSLDNLFNYNYHESGGYSPWHSSYDLGASPFNRKLWLSILAIFTVFMIIKVIYVNDQWQGVDKDMNPTDGTSTSVIEHKVPLGNGYYRIEKEYQEVGREIYGYVNKDKKFIQCTSLVPMYFDVYTISVLIGLIILGVILRKTECLSHGG